MMPYLMQRGLKNSSFVRPTHSGGSVSRNIRTGVGASYSGLLKTNPGNVTSDSPKDNLWSTSKIVDRERRVSHVSRS